MRVVSSHRLVPSLAAEKLGVISREGSRQDPDVSPSKRRGRELLSLSLALSASSLRLLFLLALVIY